ncbi:MAG: hypothetical protein Q8L68_06750, partial [Methylococcales bacterium]|nr:hypothetical protein [Methylococcales bacterium]
MSISRLITQPTRIFESGRITPPAIPASRLELKLVKGTSAVMVDAEPLKGLAVISGVATQSPAAAYNPYYLITFNCNDYDASGVYGKGILKAYASMLHDTKGIDYNASLIAYASIAGTPIAGTVITPAIITGYASILGTQMSIPGIAWVKWADKNGIFDMNKSNLAGERPMEFGDILYQSKKLGNNMVIYGKNGVAIMTPAGLMWQLKTLLRIGLKSKNAVTGNEDIHFFLDREGILWELPASGGLQMHDYSNHLSVMNNKTVMSYDERKKLVYMTDGVYGFVYSQAGLGKCPINITGMGYKGGALYVVAPAAITNTAIQIFTDIW